MKINNSSSKQYQMEGDMKRLRKTKELNFELFYEEISHAWEKKARALQARRWKMLNNATKGVHHATH